MGPITYPHPNTSTGNTPTVQHTYIPKTPLLEIEGIPHITPYLMKLTAWKPYTLYLLTLHL